MSGLSDEDVKDIALSLIGRCDDTGISFDDLGAGISGAVIAIKERAVNEALTEAADAIENGPQRLGHNVSITCRCLRCEVSEAAAAIVRTRTTA